ncbi:MAG: glycosyltransferase family 39 protein [Bacteroidota bacterium]
MGQIKSSKDYVVIALLGAVFFIPFLGGVHLFDWDEINFAEAAREMIVTGDYFHVQINFEPFWEKPPLFIWLQAASMHAFGINEFAARLPNALCGIFTLLFLFSIGKKLHGKVFGWIWVLTYLGSILPHLYFRSGIIDPWFNLLIFSSLHFLILFFLNRENIGIVNFFPKKNHPLILGGLLLGLAVLTKGPVAVLIVGLVGLVVWAMDKFKPYFTIGQVLIYGISTLFVMALWFGVEWFVNGSWFIEAFIKYQIRLFSTEDAGHGGFFGYHFVVLFFGCFPASIFALPALRKNPLAEEIADDFFPINFRKWMLALFWMVLILFSVVQSKIVHYSSLCYFPLTYLASTYLFSFVQKRKQINPKIVNTLLLLGISISSLFIALPFVGQKVDLIQPLFVEDQFALENLNAEVRWYFWDIIPGVILLITTVVSFYIFSKKDFRQKNQIRKGIVPLFVGSAFFVASSLYFFIHKIEGYTQNAAIEFYKSMEGKNVYVQNVGYKSYAPLFYTKKSNQLGNKQKQIKWLIRGEIDRDVYFVVKVSDQFWLTELAKFEEVYRKNGFVFIKRSKGLDYSE